MASEQEPQAGEWRGTSAPGTEPNGDAIPERETSEERATTATADDEGTVEAGEPDGELFEAGEREDAERRWREIQARFVDEPRSSVEEANRLVADLTDRLVSRFGDERSRLEGQWDRGEDVTTEELRLVLQRYRSFFSRLLEV
ncbi:MAG: hypothetical protein M3312_09015 [Actinomycetota bacterium]|nr:hypothetical protein [Actinomycetota bacterium]